MIRKYETEWVNIASVGELQIQLLTKKKKTKAHLIFANEHLDES